MTSNGRPGHTRGLSEDSGIALSDTDSVRPRTLVLCFDGTDDKYDHDNTNIVQIMSMLKKDDSRVQMCYYQSGIGTYMGRHFTLPGIKTISKKLDCAIAWALPLHVQAGYEFLMQNYVSGDKLCFFGFSRGAYTARALAGMLHKVGLLPKDNKQQIPFAWDFYTNVSDDGWELSAEFKENFCAKVVVDFIGVFDTVSSVGMSGKTLPFTESNHGIRVFRHAMALDERRAWFHVNHWTWTSPEDEKHPVKELSETDVQEVWFPGCHCDVGGGNVKNGEPHSLARIPLRWMIREAIKCGTGILWHEDKLKNIGLDLDVMSGLQSPVYSEKRVQPDWKCEIGNGDGMLSEDDSAMESGSGEECMDYLYEEADVFCEPLDQLEFEPSWWVLEVWPTRTKRQLPDDPNKWEDCYLMNLGQGRVIPRVREGEKGPFFHRSAKIRRDRLDYQWKATGLEFSVEPEWVSTHNHSVP